MRKNKENIACAIIQRCGGAETVAGWLGIKKRTVYYWTYTKEKHGTGGIIPGKYHDRIFCNAILAGVDLRPNDFFFLRESE